MGWPNRIIQGIRNMFITGDSHLSYTPEMKNGDSYNNSIVVNKGRQHMYVYDKKGKMTFHTPVSTGSNMGAKEKEDDMKTPVGKFSISRYEPNSDPKIYGDPRFYRLRGTNFKGIGIHGDAGHPELIGLPASHGCIRMPVDSLDHFQKAVGKQNSAGKTVYILDELGGY